MMARKFVVLFSFLIVLMLSVTLASCTSGSNDAETTALVGVETTDAPADVTVSESADVTEPESESESTDAASDDVDETTAEPSTDTQPDDVVTCVVNAVYPIPANMNVKVGDSVPAIDISKITFCKNATMFADILLATGVEAADGGVFITLGYTDFSEIVERGADEAYTIKVTSDGVEVVAANERAAFYAFNTLSQLVSDKLLPVTEITDAPSVPLRGVIEGFYGVAWSHQYRMELMDFMGDVKMNCYIYAPKDDAKHRAQWRSLYTNSEIDVLSELIEAAQDNYVRFVYAISPGLDIDLGKGYEKDLEKLIQKFEQLYDLGVRDYAVLLDDIPTLDAEGHAKLLNDIQTQFVETHDGVNDLIAITTEYTDWMLTEYTDKIAPLLHKDLKLMWTGSGVAPDTITEQSLAHINEKYGRKVFIWWNYPVNDILSNNIYMDACRGNEATLYNSISGLVSNPMNQGNASYVPLFTTADYLWNTTAYDPDTSLKYACDVIDPDIREALLHFIDMTCSSPMNGYKTTHEFRKTFTKYVFGQYDAELVETILAEFTKMVEYADIIKTAENTTFVEEITPWLDKYRAFGEMGIAYFNLVKAKAEGADYIQLLAYAKNYYDVATPMSKNLKIVSPDVLGIFFESCDSKINQLLGLSTNGESTITLPVPSSPLAVYESYAVEYMADGNHDTFFWSGCGLNVGDYIMIDLGVATKVHAVDIRMGVAGHSADYMQKSELLYSIDGRKWESLGKFTSRNILVENLDIKARYVKLAATAQQVNWLTVSEFFIDYSLDGLTDKITSENDFISRNDLISLTDSNLFTSFVADPSTVKGKSIIIEKDAGETVEIFSMMFDSSTKIVCKDASGNVISESELTEYTAISDSKVATVEITFGDKAVLISEITWSVG